MAIISASASVAFAQPQQRPDEVLPMATTEPTPSSWAPETVPTIEAPTPAPTSSSDEVTPPPIRYETRAVAPAISKIQIKRGTTYYDVNHAVSLLVGESARFRVVSSKGPDFPRGSVSWTSDGDASLYSPSIGAVDVQKRTVTGEGGFTLTAKTSNSVSVRVIVGKIGLYNVSFKNNTPLLQDGDIMGSAYSQPEWQSTKADKNQSPLCYYGGQRLNAGANFYVVPSTCAVKANIRAVAQGGGVTYTFPKKAVTTGSSFNYPNSDADKAMARSVIIYESLPISWQVQTGSSWNTIGTSNNKMYRTLNKPVSGTPMYLTVVDVACRNAQGSTTQTSVTSQIWNVFLTKHVNSAGGMPMKYWLNEGDESLFDVSQLCQDFPQMINPNWMQKVKGVGTCQAWVDFMIATLRAHGIANCSRVEIRASAKFATSTPLDTGLPRGMLLIKNWSFNSQGSAPADCRPTWTHLKKEIYDQLGASAQITPNPPGRFTNHFIVKVGSKYYDPSYGNGPFSSPNSWERSSIAGYLNKCKGEVVAKQDAPNTQETSFLLQGQTAPTNWGDK